MTRHATDEHRLVLQAWLGTRLLFLLISFAIAAWGGTPLSRQYANWDVAHFDAIARNGYAVANDMAFFPGLPLLMRALMTVGIEPALGGVLLSLFGSLAATWALVRIAGAWGAIAWLLVPTGVFTFVGYTESLFCAAAFWAWERATKGRWGAAAVLAAGACTLRVSGIFLIGALAILAWSQAGRGGAKVRGRTSGTAWWTRAWAWLLVPVAVVASYATYLHSLTGSWTAWFSAQAAGWSRGFTWPWQSFLNSWASVQPGAYPEHPEWVWVFRGEMLSMAVGLIVTLICLFRRRDRRSRMGRRPGAGVLAVVLVHEREPGRDPVVPAVASDRRVRRIPTPDAPVAHPRLGGGHRGARDPGPLGVAVLHRSLVELTAQDAAASDSGAGRSSARTT